MTVLAPDRLEKLLNQTTLTGIDFVEVDSDGRTLYVHFYKPPNQLSSITREQVIIYQDHGNDTPTQIHLARDPEPKPDDADVLKLVTEITGDFSPWHLQINHPSIDPYFNDIQFSFKAFCPRDVDCKLREHECPPEQGVDYPVDYNVRDFWSLRRALMEFTSQRYPDWQDRGREADFGVMFAGVLSALGDELAYYQDCVAREAYLETATQRRSVRRHARLVDYEMHDGLVAHTWLDVTVQEGGRGSIPAGFNIYAASEYGSPITYEVGEDLREILRRRVYEVDAARNRFVPHIWDENDTCLPVGATELVVRGHHKSNLPLEQTGDGLGRWMLLKTNPDNPAYTARVWLVWVIRVEDEDEQGNPLVDQLIIDENTQEPTLITRLVWDKKQALPFELELDTLEVRGNLVPVFAGTTIEKRFVIRAVSETFDLPWEEKVKIDPAIERTGPNGVVTYLYSLAGTDTDGLCWNGNDVHMTRPEIYLLEDEFDSASGKWTSESADFSEACEKSPKEWCWRRSLIGMQSSQPQDEVFTLDDGQWARVVGYQRMGHEIVHKDYKSDAGVTIRFGDDEFGRVPKEGTLFKAIYRIGNGRRANVAAGSINRFGEKDEVLDETGGPVESGALIHSVTNPFSVTSGTDPETLDEVRQLAPEAFRAITYRAVTERDYAEAAERLPWVQRAGAAFLWTGSWLSAFVTPDPYGATSVTPSQRAELGRQLNRFRQAGREVHMMNPKYVNLDLEIHICVEPSSYREQVNERVMEKLFGKAGILQTTGFFSSDNFTFGTPLERSVLESEIQDVPGVRAVKEMYIERRGYFKKKDFTEMMYPVANNEVIRVENDPNHADWGTVKLVMEGGA